MGPPLAQSSISFSTSSDFAKSSIGHLFFFEFIDDLMQRERKKPPAPNTRKSATNSKSSVQLTTDLLSPVSTSTQSPLQRLDTETLRRIGLSDCLQRPRLSAEFCCVDSSYSVLVGGPLRERDMFAGRKGLALQSLHEQLALRTL